MTLSLQTPLSAAPPPRLAPQPPASSPPPDDGPTAPDSGLSAADFARKQYLNNYLIRNRDYSVLLRTATSALESGDVRQAIDALQSIWDAPHDVLTWNDTHGRPESARLCADDLMRRIDASTRDAYERCYGGAAAQLLSSVLREHDGDAERELLRRFAHTRAAGELLDLKAQRAIDRGDLEMAAEYWRRLLDDPWLRSGLPAPRVDSVLSLCERLRGRRESGPGSRRTGSVVSPPTRESLWSVRFLDESTRRIETDRGAAADNVIDDLSDAVRAWADRQKIARMPLGGAGMAVTAGNRVMVRDFSGVTAYDVGTGHVQWRYACESALCALLEEEEVESETRTREHRRPPSNADFFADQVADHSTLSTLTTDGERLYVIDGIQCVEAAAADGDSGKDAWRGRGPVLRNRLLALTVDGLESGRLVWSRGATDEESPSELDDFYFLGPPRPCDGRLYAIGEQDDELQVVVLEARTGRLAWKQSIALTDRSVAECAVRARTACVPQVVSGVVVCATQSPILVGLDAITGSLLWVYHAAGEERPDATTWTRAGRGADAESAPGEPVIVGHRIVFVPPESRNLHCVDVRSGRRLWWADAREVRFLSSAPDGLVLLVTSDECIGLRLTDGGVRWRTPIGAPSGRGVVAGDTFLLPLNSGRLLELKLSDGSIRPNLLEPDGGSISLTGTVGRPLPAPEQICGNLMIHEDLVVSSSSTGLSVLPQARSLLNRLLVDRPTVEVAPADVLRRAELHMQLAEYNDAIEVLRSLLAAAPSGPVRESATRRLRELLYVDIATDTAAKLEELADLATTPSDAARQLLQRLSYELDAGLLESAARTVAAIRDVAVAAPIPLDHTGRYLVLPLEQARFALEQFASAADLTDLDRFRTALRASLGVDDEADVERLREAAVLFGRWDHTEDLVARLARRLVSDGDSQEAELLIWNGRAGRGAYEPVDPIRPSGRETTIQLLSHMELGRELPTAGRHVVSFHPDHESRPVLAGFEEPNAIPAVDIREVTVPETGAGTDSECSPPCLSAILDGKSHFWTVGRKTVRLLQTEEQSAGVAVERFTVMADGITGTGSIEAPPARWKLPAPRRYAAGHLVPVCGDGVLMLSLLERRTLWHVPANPADGLETQLGPFGADFCVLQQGEDLTVVNPITGRTLWRRQGLRHGAGLATDDETGVIGDSSVLIVFDPDLTGYELFDTRSGASLRRGVMPLERPAGTRHLTSFGRNLMYRTEIAGVPRLRIWDPLEDRLLTDVPLRERFIWNSVPEQQRAAVLQGRSLCAINGATGECEWEIDVVDEHLEHVRKIQMFSAGAVDFVLLDRHVRDAHTSITSLDVRVPATDLSGDLYAIDRASGVPLWSGPLLALPCRLLHPPAELPFLVTVTRVRDEQDQEAYRLRIDVIDVETGRLVGTRSNLTNMPILHTGFAPADGGLTLWGPDRRIEIGYSVLPVTRH